VEQPVPVGGAAGGTDGVENAQHVRHGAGWHGGGGAGEAAAGVVDPNGIQDGIALDRVEA
jgi:hypothetical protein